MEKNQLPQWRTLFLWGWGILILLAGALTMLSWVASWIVPTISKVGTLVALIWVLCLIWLSVFLEDFGVLLAMVIAGLVWMIYTTLEVQVEAGIPSIIAGGCLLGGTLGGIAGGILRKVNRSGQTTSLMLTVIGSLLGFVFGYAVIALFSWMMWA